MAGPKASSLLYKSAFAWNLFWGLPLLLVPELAMPGIGLAAPQGGTGELHARAVGGAVLLFGWFYLTIGRDIAAYRPFLGIAILAKTLFFLIVVFVWLRHTELGTMLVISLGDLAFGLLFLRDWRALR